MADNAMVWERPEPPERPSLGPLSRERIVTAAMTLADGEGLEAVSIRKVAGVLDVGPMRLYRYVDTKEELLELMVDAVYAEIPAPTGTSWRAILRSYATGKREAVLAHEWFADLLGGRPKLGPSTLAHSESILSALRAAPDLDGVDAVMSAFEVLAVFVDGAVRKEVTERRLERSTGQDKAEWQAAAGPYLERMLATGRYPALDEVVREATHHDAAAVFELGLDYLLDGIEARLPSSRSGHSSVDQ